MPSSYNQRMTARELATALLNLPNPDLPVVAPMAQGGYFDDVESLKVIKRNRAEERFNAGRVNDFTGLPDSYEEIVALSS